jgi:hypothetical protein
VKQVGFYEHPQNIAQISGKNSYYLNMRTKCAIIPLAQINSAIRFGIKYNIAQSNNTKINEIILPSLRHREWIDS